MKARPTRVRNRLRATSSAPTVRGAISRYSSRSVVSVSPPIRAGATGVPPRPPVTGSHSLNTKVRMNCAASVAIARYSPFSLRDGRPAIIPTAAASRPPSGRQR